MGLIPVGLSLRKVMYKSQCLVMFVSASVSLVTSIMAVIIEFMRNHKILYDQPQKRRKASEPTAGAQDPGADAHDFHGAKAKTLKEPETEVLRS